MPRPRPSRRLLTVLAVAVGLLAGLGTYTFGYAGGHAYMSSDPAVCANCHVMRDQYDGWAKSGHRSVAVCNDCHLPHGAVAKLATKASNGFWHSLAFTTGRFPEPIRIKPHNRRIAEDACRGCHAAIAHSLDASGPPGERAACLRCHGSVGHPTFMPPAAGPAR